MQSWEVLKVKKWLKEIRDSKEMTMKTVAVAAGISECYYSQIENGSRGCSVTVAKKIAEVLGFDWQKFFE